MPVTGPRQPGSRQWDRLFPRREFPTQNQVPTGPPVTSAEQVNTLIAASASSSDVQIFTASGTWVNPGAGVMVMVIAIGGGGGGGSGRRGAAGTNRNAGGGGAGGGRVIAEIATSSLHATEPVTVGAGGAGAAGITAN